MIRVSITGRLIQVRLKTPIVAEEIEAMVRDVATAGAGVSTRVVGVTDLRAANILPTEFADQFIAFLKSRNASLERAAYLTGESALFSLQLERILREVKSPVRRSFRQRAELEVWLGEVLTPAERRGLETFLSEGELDLSPRESDRPPPRSR
jgi:hypothetical protein